jgi:hypothetical protein
MAKWSKTPPGRKFDSTRKILMFKKILLQTMEQKFFAPFFEIKIFAIVGSNLRAQRCLTCQIVRATILPTWPSRETFFALWAETDYSSEAVCSSMTFMGRVQIPLHSKSFCIFMKFFCIRLILSLDYFSFFYFSLSQEPWGLAKDIIISS